MTAFLQSHGGAAETRTPTARDAALEALRPADGDVAVDEAADFGYLLPPSEGGGYDPGDIAALDALAEAMVPEVDDTDADTLAPVLTYWGQFLDHEMTARTDRESDLTRIDDPAPVASWQEIERKLKNARTPRLDLDSVYGAPVVGPFESEEIRAAAARVRAGMRHPGDPAKMRVGTAVRIGDLPDGLDRHRDLPRFHQVEPEVREAMLTLVRAQLAPGAFRKFEATLPKRAIIGDMRNDENIIVAQFHLSFLRFHNKVVDFLRENDTGWIADFEAAKTLTTLHYQWLAVEGYLKSICQEAVVDRVLADRAAHFRQFRADYAARNPGRVLGNALPLEFSVAAFRFGHSMVRGAYDYNRTFGRPNGEAPFDQIFAFTGGGELGASLGLDEVSIPQNWIIDWTRFVEADTSFDDGGPQRCARAIDTAIAPPLGDMVNEGEGQPNDLRALLRHLARRNIRRGVSLRLPTGQALHAHLKSIGAVTSEAQTDARAWVSGDMAGAMEGRMASETPLWVYCLAEAEAAGGGGLGEMGSWIVASTFIAALLDDPGSALGRGFEPAHSPLRTDGQPIDTIGKWMRFALVME